MNDYEIIDRVKKAIKPLLEMRAIELVEATYRREGRRKALRLLIDKPNGITLDECVQVNRLISPLLDGLNVFEGPYIIEVSSPGLDRPLVSRQDFERVVGALVKVTMKFPLEGSSRWIGRMEKVEDETIVIKTEDGISREVPLEKIAKARREIRF